MPDGMQFEESAGAESSVIDPGMSAEAFAAEVFEQRPYRQTAAVKAPSPVWREIDELLHHLEPGEAGFQLFRRGLIPQATYTRDAVLAGQRRRCLLKAPFYESLRSGATLVMNRIEQDWPRAQALCTALARFTGMTATGNAYLSFSGTGSFGHHWDTHDVFALQLIGRKRWQLFAPTFPLPLSQHASQALGHPPPTVPVLDLVLEPGDLLYVPRGWWHQVLPFEEASLHLSVGTYGPSVLDYLLWVASRVLPQDIRARSSLGTGVAEDIAGALHSLQTQALDPAALAAFRRTLREREHRSAAFDLGLLAAADGASSLRDDATLRLLGRVDDDAPHTVVLNGVRHRLDPLSLAIVRELQAGARPVAEVRGRLPGLRSDSLTRSILELARHELISVGRP